MEATELLKSHGMNIGDGEPDLYQIANTIMELTISRAGIPAHQADILKALSTIIEKIADDSFETATESPPAQIKT
jgi:hypothetical protein